MNRNRKFQFSITILALLIIVSNAITSFKTQNLPELQINDPLSFHKSSEAPPLQWNTTWGGSISDYGQSVAIDTNTGAIYCLGNTYSFGTGGSRDFFLVKFSPNGFQIWNTTWGSSADEEAYGVAVDANTGAIYCHGSSNWSSSALVKYYPNGSKAWEATWPAPFSTGVAVDSAGDIFCASSTNTKLLLVKYFSNGTQDWNTSEGLADFSYGFDITTDTTGNIYCTGNTPDGLWADFLLVKFHPNGTEAWNATWGHPSFLGEGYGVAVDLAGNIYCTGLTERPGIGFDLLLIKFHPNGTRAWNTTWGGPTSESGTGVTIDSTGAIYCSGWTNSFGSLDMALVKFHPNGTSAWNTTWGGSNSDRGEDIAIASSGAIYCVGETQSFGAGDWDLALVKFGQNIPNINFQITEQYLNTTIPLETDVGLEINCSVSNSSTLQWVYLCENSTGQFVNRSMSLGDNGEWSHVLNISDLQRGDYLSFSFYAKDSQNLTGKNDNGGLNFTILIGDFSPPTSIISFQPCDNPNYVSISTSFTINATDLGTGVSDLNFMIDSSGWFPYTAPFNLYNYSHGPHMIIYNATDNSGNIESSHFLTVFLDRQSPNITFQISPAYIYQFDGNLEISCEIDDDTSLTWVYLCENSTGVFANRSMTYVAGKYRYDFGISSLDMDDRIAISFYANDSAGNIAWDNNAGMNYVLLVGDYREPPPDWTWLIILLSCVILGVVSAVTVIYTKVLKPRRATKKPPIKVKTPKAVPEKVSIPEPPPLAESVEIPLEEVPIPVEKIGPPITEKPLTTVKVDTAQLPPKPPPEKVDYRKLLSRKKKKILENDAKRKEEK